MDTPQLVKLVMLLAIIGLLVFRSLHKAKEDSADAPTRQSRSRTAAGGGSGMAEAKITEAGTNGPETPKAASGIEVEPLTEPVTFTLAAPAPGKLVTEDGSLLELPPGELTVQLAFAFLERNDEEAIDLVESQLSLQAEDGTTWTGTGGFGGVFAYEALLETEATPRAFFEKDAPQPWLASLEGSCLITGIRDLWDDRLYYHPTIGDQEVTIHCKYQGPSIDLALHREAGDPHLLVRVRGLYEAETFEMLDPILFLLDPTQLVFRNSVQEDEGARYDDGEDQPMVVREGG